MKRLLSLLVLTASLLAPRVVRAQNPLGTVSASYSYNASKVLADPVRNRVYVADTATNSVIVLDTTTLQAMATVLVGSHPVDLAISPDGNTLYVANGGSTLAALALLDLNALVVRATYPLANPPVAIAAGLANRLYVSASPDGFSTAIYQLDATTGAVQATFNSGYYDNNLLAIGPDDRTLFVANNSEEPGDLKSFDVSTPVSATLQDNERISTFPPELVISHGGKYLCLPSGGNTYLYSTADITAYYGSLEGQEGSGGGALAFSPDDTLVYQANGSNLDVFNTTSFTEVNHAALPAGGGEYSSLDSVRQVVIDHTGSYLFVAATTYDNSPGDSGGSVAVVATGTGPLSAPSILPVINSPLTVMGARNASFTYQITATNQPTRYAATNLPYGLELDNTTGIISGTTTETGTFTITLQATNAVGMGQASLTLTMAAGLPIVSLGTIIQSVDAGTDNFGEFTVSLSEKQDHDVVVNFTVAGSAANGTDYTLFKGTKKIKAGQTGKPIKIFPQGDLGGARKVVALTLAPGDGYIVGTTGKVKVTIFAPRPIGP